MAKELPESSLVAEQQVRLILFVYNYKCEFGEILVPFEANVCWFILDFVSKAYTRKSSELPYVVLHVRITKLLMKNDDHLSMLKILGFLERDVRISLNAE